MRFSPRLEVLLASIPVGGLYPKAWIVVESGVSREEVKEAYLSRGIGFVSSAIQDVTGIAGFILGPLVERDRVLSAPSRQELLRRLISERKPFDRLPEIRRLKRQRGFYLKLDRAVQAARLTYVSASEREAQEERLQAVFVGERLRTEMRQVIEQYEEWLVQHKAWDLPRLILAAIGVLDTLDIPLDLPPKIVVLSAKSGESRSEALWESLSRRTTIQRIFIADLQGTEFPTMECAFPEEKQEATWEVWHTVDDACDRLADALLEEYEKGRLHESGVLLPDQPTIRRSLKRALDERGLVLKDPRDPTRLRWEESIKGALLPIEVVARRFRQEEVLSFLHSRWMRLDANPELEFAQKRVMEQEIRDRGIRFGLAAYSGDRLERIRAMLELLNEAFSARVRVDEVAAFHLAWIRRNADFQSWVHEFFKSVWERFSQDLSVIGETGRRAPVLYWLERIKLRLEEATPPFEKIQYANGVEVFRLGQTPLRYPERLWCVALPPRYTVAENLGDYYYSDRERELLSGHFAVRSGAMESEFRRKVLKFWLLHAREIIFLDALYDWDGGERESIEPMLQELGIVNAKGTLLEAIDQGSHPRWRKSYLHPRTSPSRTLTLPEMGAPGARPEIRASDLEAFSRCELQGVLLGRFRANDSKISDLDIRGDSRGTLLHEAVKRLVQNRNDRGQFSIRADEALEQAWLSRRPRGLFQSERLTKYTKQKLVPILEAFMLQETKYVERSETKVLALEEPKLKYVVDLGPTESGRDQVTIVGIPDRIDEHPEGLFIIDYKSSGDSPNATQMIDLGYRLQMPIYAIAAANHFKKPVIGLQFVTFDRKGSRARGIFFKKWNGKTPGSLTATTGRSASLVDRAPEEVWGKLAEEIENHTRRYLSGHASVKPKPAKTGGLYAECESCFVRDACGQRRFLDDVDSSEEGDSGDE